MKNSIMLSPEAEINLNPVKDKSGTFKGNRGRGNGRAGQ